MNKNIYDERTSSQKPALELLQHLGYHYISTHGAPQMCDNFYHLVLTTVLNKQINTINRYEYNGTYRSFSEDNIEKAVRDIDIPLTDGLIQTNEKIYDVL